MFDTLITRGTVVDGTGAAAMQSDIGITGDRITACGDLRGAEAARVIDATGCLVTPGFIDAHAHSDTYLLIEPDAPSKLAQGITTEINGQCGGSGVPKLGEARLSSDWASMDYPARDGTIQHGPTWQTVADYRALFERVRPAINTIQFIGHNTLRAGVMGYAPRHATQDDVKQLCATLEEALDEGGWGLTTGLLYQPGKYAEPAEIEALARVTARKGGMYATHMRSEGDDILGAIDEVLHLARTTGIRVEISHLKTSGKHNWGKIDTVLETLNAARDAGLIEGSDRYPYCAAGTDLDVVLPEWASAGGRDPELARIRDRATRATIVEALDTCGRDWSTVMLGGGWSAHTRPWSGQTVAAAAVAQGITPGALVCDFIDADDTRTGAFFFGMCEENLHRIYEQPWIVPGSDASLRAPWGPLGADHPHPRAYGTMPRFFRALTGRLDGFSTICGREAAIHRMTGMPAARFGIRGRGTLAVGNFADIAVWREDAFCDVATYTAPHAFATGMVTVLVNGVAAYENGTFTHERAGRYLTRN